MTKEDFSKHGVSIVLPDDPNYGSELGRLGASVKSSAERPGSFAVVVKNTSGRAIAAFGMRFTKRFADGRIATSDIVASQPSALLDLGQPGRYDRPPEGLIMPGAARLVTTDGMVGSTNTGLMSYRTTTPWKIIKVELDSVVFDDGEATGPDDLGVVERLRSHIDAQQDLMEEISDRLSHRELLHDILQELQRTASSKAEPDALKELNPRYVYDLARQQYLKELSTTEANAGDEIALRRFKQLKYVTRPTIHREKEGD
jgi:hypothetical protein